MTEKNMARVGWQVHRDEEGEKEARDKLEKDNSN